VIITIIVNLYELANQMILSNI